MRKGQNPGKLGIKSYTPPVLAIIIINFIPEESGYFSESLNILKTQIASLHKNTDRDFDLVVFDNGSCSKVQRELNLLVDQNKIDFLVLSRHNLGKMGAINFIIPALPHKWICFTDGDVLFRQGWLEASMHIYNKFPNAGMVSAQPAFFESEREDTFTLSELYRSGCQVKRIQLEGWIADEYCRGIGADEKLHEKYLAKKLDCVLNDKGNIVSVVGATHMQFLSLRKQLVQVLPIPSKFTISREEDSELDSRISQNKLYRLSTANPFVVHMGNHLDEFLIEEIGKMQLENISTIPITEGANKKLTFSTMALAWLNKSTLFGKLFKRLYKELFILYSIDRK